MSDNKFSIFNTFWQIYDKRCEYTLTKKQADWDKAYTPSPNTALLLC